MNSSATFGEVHAEFEDDLLPEPHGVSQDHEEEQLIKDGNALIQRDLEVRKNKRESYARGQALNRKPDMNKLNNLSLVDWSGFPAAAHSPGHAAERKRASSFRKAKQDAENGKDGKEEQKPSSFRNRRLAKLNISEQEPPTGRTGRQGKGFDNERQRRRASMGAVPTTDDDGTSGGLRAKYKNRRHSQRNLKSISPPPPPPEARHRAERTGRTSRLPRQLSSSKQPASPNSRVRRPVAAAASSTTLEVSKKPPQRSASGMRRVADDRGTSAFRGESRKKGSFTW